MISRDLCFIAEGCAQEFIYNDILPILGTGTDMKTVAKKVGVDMGFISPFICIPMAYLVKGLLLGNTFFDSMGDYWDDVCDLYGSILLSLHNLR